MSSLEMEIRLSLSSPVARFENVFGQLVKELPNMIEPDFSSIQQLKGQNKEILELAFQDELKEHL